jgi:xylulokinase
MADPLVAAVDCGTTAIKAGVFNGRGKLLALARRECPCLRPGAGRAEIDPGRLAKATLTCLAEAVRGVGARRKQIVGLAVTNQRATMLCADDAGHPVGRGISWQDGRGAEEMPRLRRCLDARRFYRTTGLPLDPVFTLAKVAWLRRHDRALWSRTSRFLLVQDFALRLLGCREFVTDWSNASLTGLLDVKRLRWDELILEAAGIPPGRLPSLAAPGTPVGRVSAEAARQTGLPEGALLVAGAGDQQCAGLGAGAVRPGVVEITLGTVAVALSYSSAVALDPQMRIMCCAHGVPGRWSIEGLQTAAGTSVEWARRVARAPGLRDAAFARAVARVPPGAGGALFYPYLDGASAPHWHETATGLLLGLRSSHDAPAIMRAVLEGVALETRQVLDVFESLGVAVRDVRLTGGYSEASVWRDLYADVLGRPVSALENPDATLLGAAMLAACGAGLHPSVGAAARAMVRLRQTRRPDPDRAAAYRALSRRHADIGIGFRQAGLFRRLGEDL